MPLVTEFIDAFREFFGEGDINQQIKRGIAGEGCFFAEENGIEVGSRQRIVSAKGE